MLVQHGETWSILYLSARLKWWSLGCVAKAGQGKAFACFLWFNFADFALLVVQVEYFE